MPTDDEYGLSPGKNRQSIEPPSVDYLPPKPKTYRPKIGLIGAGGISELHLKNYQACGFEVVAIASRTRSKAEQKRDRFFPEAEVFSDHRKLLDQAAVDVIDVTPHPQDRLHILFDCLDAGKHVLSQKPFVLNLEDGEKLIDLADHKGLKIAVNQNGRWAPHFSFIRNAIARGLIGRLVSVDFSLQWDHTWIRGIPALENIHHIVLFDFGVHWFDITCCFFSDRKPLRVYASTVRYPEQFFRPPSLASAVVDYKDAQVRITFNAHTRQGEEDVTTIVGTKGTLRSRGPGLNNQPEIQLYLEQGSVAVPLKGSWFESGFQGSMGELLCAIEENREPDHSAKNNINTLELSFAAMESANRGLPVEPGTIRSLPD